LAACTAGAILASTIAHGETPVTVPKATEALLAGQQVANMRWAALQLIALAIPLFFLFTGLGARLRRMCESISGRRWLWTTTLFVCVYLIVAALIALPFDYFVGYIRPHDSGWGHRTLADMSFTVPGYLVPANVSINRWDEVTGSYAVQGPFGEGFVRFPDGKIEGFQAPDSTATYSMGIDDFGVVTRYFTPASTVATGFLRIP
jgi:hypothetical protein